MSDAPSDNPLLSQPVGPALRRLSTPIGVGMICTFLFQVVDTWFVGKLGSDALAALAFSATVYFFAVAALMGLAVGISALVGAALGAGDALQARRVTTLGLLTATGLTMASIPLGLFTVEPLFLALGAEPELLPLIDAYMAPLYMGLPCLAMALAAGASLRASGAVLQESVVMGVAGVINLALDALLIFGLGGLPALGIQGAAVATVISWGFAGICLVGLLWRRRGLTRQLQRPGAELKRLAHLSSPAVLTQVLLPVIAMLLTWALARFGPEAVAAFGVIQRIETLVLVGISAVSVGLVPFVAQNAGAGLGSRVSAAVIFSGRTAVYWGAAAALVLLLAGRPLIALFTTDPALIEHAMLYVYTVGLSFPAMGLMALSAALLNGVQRSGRALQVLLVRAGLTGIATLIGMQFSVLGVFLAVAAAHGLGALYSGRVLNRQLPEAMATLPPSEAYRADWRALALRIRSDRS